MPRLGSEVLLDQVRLGFTMKLESQLEAALLIAGFGLDDLCRSVPTQTVL